MKLLPLLALLALLCAACSGVVPSVPIPSAGSFTLTDMAEAGGR